MKTSIILALLTLFIASCVSGPTPLPEGAVDTAVAGTLAAASAAAPSETATAIPTDTTLPTDTPLPPNTDTPEPMLPEGAECIPTETERTQGVVTRVVDGDTIDVDIDGQVFRVRYIGMDTPESTTEIEYFGHEASAFNAGLVEGKTVTLIKDVSETDRFERLLRYVIVDGFFVNYELVKMGFATGATFPPDVACQETFSAAEAKAREENKGLWGPTPTPLPTYTQLPQPTATNPPPPPPQPTSPPTSSNCDPSYPTVCIPPKSQVGDLDCGDIPYRRFQVLPPDPHGFDGDNDGIGCESG